MKQKINKWLVAFLIIATSSFSQTPVATFNYNSLTNECDVFGNITPYQGYFHQTNVGDIGYDSNDAAALKLKFEYNYTGGPKGSEFTISDFQFKANYSYTVKITAKNTGTYNAPAALKCNFNASGISPACDGTGGSVSSQNSAFTSQYFQAIIGTNFTEYVMQSTALPTAQTRLSIGTIGTGNWTGSSSDAVQTIYIQKIEIFETPPPPTFTLTSSTSSIPCGSTTPVTFTVNNVYSSPGTLSYNWSVGSGWSGPVSTSASSITLTPTSFPYSPISVTPVLNGVPQPTKTVTITLTPFTSSAAISGAVTVCTSATYTLNGLLAGQSLAWSISNTSVATITGASGNTVTVNKVGNGVVTLTATITNSCNQTKPINRTINVGSPSFPTTNMTGDASPLTGQYKVYSVPVATGATSYNWYFDVGGVLSTNINGWEISNGQGTTSITAKVGNPGITVVVCKASNSCSNTIKYTYVTVRSQTDPCSEFRIVTTNPIKRGKSVMGVILPPPTDPCDELYQKIMQKGEKREIKLFDFSGRLVYSNYFYSDAFELNNLDLKKGTYILSVKLPDTDAKREILIVE